MFSRIVGVTLLAALAMPAADTPIYFSGEVAGIGDPNPYYENGVYSVFYLKNEGRHPFWLSQTTDLSAWSKPIEAVPVGKPGTPDVWTGSGSVIADPAGGYRLYYTGHNPEGRPKEVVMEARASTLAGPWRKIPETSFAGLPDYDQWDFRDPFVFWNAEAKAWWMVLATRQAGKAVIGLYTSPDLARWTARPPLYTEASPLNLEVPDLFPEGKDWFLLYSDQRDQSRQVRYLTSSHSAGPYAYGPYDALDGRAFYAGKTAGTGAGRLLFGWVAHKRQRQDAMGFVWGGDLIAHALRRTGNGQLAVSLPDGIARQFDMERAKLSLGAQAIGSAQRRLLVKADVTVKPGDRFGVTFQTAGAKDIGTLALDSRNGEATFVTNGDPAGTPHVAFPASATGRYTLDLVIEPELGLGILYINAFRALSFRYYQVGRTTASFFADRGFSALSGSVRIRKTDAGGDARQRH